MNKNNPNSFLSYILLAGVIICACSMVVIAYGMVILSSPPTNSDIVLPDNITAIEIEGKDRRLGDGDDNKCFHLVKADDGTPDYVIGPC